MHKNILRIAIPSILSNITVPLLGWVDTAITGHLHGAPYLAAIAIGASLFSTIYVLFNFLRMGIGGLTAQTFGRGRREEAVLLLWRGLFIANVIALCLLLLQKPIAVAALSLMGGSAAVQEEVLVYYRLLIWGAPPMLSLYVLNGWLLGMQNAHFPMIVAVLQNVINVVVSVALVYGGDLKLAGVAGGTLAAQWCGALMALFFALRWINRMGTRVAWKAVFRQPGAWSRFFTVNVFILLRTLCLVMVMFAFTAFGSRQGATLLSVNALLLQFFTLVSYLMDGFAYAGEAVGGRLVGQGDERQFHHLVRDLFLWGALLTLLFTVLFVLGGTWIVELFTDDVAVRRAAVPFLPYACVIPVVSMAGFLLDGLFVGTTATVNMLLGVAVAALGFFVLYAVLLPFCQNHAIWIAFLSYLALRGLVQGGQLPTVMRRSFHTFG